MDEKVGDCLGWLPTHNLKVVGSNPTPATPPRRAKRASRVARLGAATANGLHLTDRTDTRNTGAGRYLGQQWGPGLPHGTRSVG